MANGWWTDRFGPSEVLQWRDLGELAPGPGQIRVGVHASGVNFAEVRMLAGTYSGIELPLVLGMESAGVVEAVGEGVTRFKAGDRVFGRARGSHAEAVLFDERLASHIPDNLTFEEAAAVPVGWHTAWHALITVAQLKPGQRVLIEAIGSSVGSAALQIAKARGAWVAATASRDDKLEIAKSWGADAVYNYKDAPFSEAVLRDTDGEGVDIALMTIGGETAGEVLESLGNNGKAVMYGSTGGREVTFDLGIGTRNIALLSMSISTSPEYFSQTLGAFEAEALPLFRQGVFKPVVGPILPVAEVARAHQLIDDRSHYGKIVLKVRD